MRAARLLLLTSLLTSLWIGVSLGGASLYAAAPLEEEMTHAHDTASQIVTEDAELKDQIVKVEEALSALHPEMARLRNAIKQEPDPARKAALYAELDSLREDHDALERILHDLVEEATATEWTKIDEALKKARSIEQYQEKASRREEVIRDRQQ